MKTCTKCGLPKVRARGLCKKHYEEWLSLNPERAWKKTEYPSDEDLVTMAKRFDKLRELAAELGISQGSLRDYLKIRPQLREDVTRTIKDNKVRIDPKDSKLRWKLKNPDKVREYNRRWGRNQDPAKRAKWNSYNRERRANLSASVMTDEDVEYATLLRKDPCSYCLTYDSPTIDHIIPIEGGGTSEWQNLTLACHSCNSSKNDDLLLKFMLRKAIEADTLRSLERSR